MTDDRWTDLAGLRSCLTNAEIAAQHAIAPKTASAHVEHILAKLGADVAAWAATISRSPGAHATDAGMVAAYR